MNIQDIREMEEKELIEKIGALETELMKMRMGNSIGLVDSPIEIRKARRNVARLRTVLRQRATKNS